MLVKSHAVSFSDKKVFFVKFIMEIGIKNLIIFFI